jgi:hypothetical protein
MEIQRMYPPLRSAHFRDSGNKDPNDFQDMNDEITDHVKKIDNSTYVIILSDTNVALGVRLENANIWKPIGTYESKKNHEI